MSEQVPSKKLGASCLAGGHPRAPNDSRGELELCLRDAFAAGCEATAQRSLVTAAVYAHRETPVVAERLRAAHEPSARHSEATLLADEITAADAETLLAGELMDRVCAFLRASQPPAPEWQPIETAPKDGTAFLAVSGNWIVCMCWNKHRRDWCTVDKHYCPLPDDETFTHWMPLPSPPTKAPEHCTACGEPHGGKCPYSSGGERDE